MLKYGELKGKPREFLSVTSLTDEEFQVLLPTFEKCYQSLLPPKPKPTKKHKQRAKGGGRKSKLVTCIDTGEHNWLNFSMEKEQKIDLFVRGLKRRKTF